jgi:hypothetical protein
MEPDQDIALFIYLGDHSQGVEPFQDKDGPLFFPVGRRRDFRQTERVR